MGLSFTLETPIKVARYGISSVVSIIQDELIEHMRKHYCEIEGEEYVLIPKTDVDRRAKRVKEYLNLINRIVNKQVTTLKTEAFEKGSDIVKYFEMLPETSLLKLEYIKMLDLEGDAKVALQDELRTKIVPGEIDVNIMTKVDNMNRTKDGELLPVKYSDAVSALRGFAASDVNSSVVFSAGMNPRLYAYLEEFDNFFPDRKGYIEKKVILKVSDYRSALIQGKFLAKKGIWVSEFRIESGLNCGGHAFPTNGVLAGPALEEFKNKKPELIAELIEMCNKALTSKEKYPLPKNINSRITYQGGIGTFSEDKFLREYYNLDATGWGSPFLFVPEATTVDEETLQSIVNAKQSDYYLSRASPLGIPFNNFRNTSSEAQRKLRILKNRAGSPCKLKYLSFNTEYTDTPICVSSRVYLNTKLKEIDASSMSESAKKAQIEKVTEKDCLCEGLSTGGLVKNGIPDPSKLNAVSICPGPNSAYFSSVSTLEEMIAHIYGRGDILNALPRPHVFVNEMVLYLDYLKEEIQINIDCLTKKQVKSFNSFKDNMLEGVDYYMNLVPDMPSTDEFNEKMKTEIESMKDRIVDFFIPEPAEVNLEGSV
jgi:hypothetical protein